MVLVAFLGSRLGSPTRKRLTDSQMPRAVGEGKIRKRAGTTPPSAAAPPDALVVPALCLGSAEQKQINCGSIRYLELIAS
jgi:hypothetical protein